MGCYNSAYCSKGFSWAQGTAWATGAVLALGRGLSAHSVSGFGVSASPCREKSHYQEQTGTTPSVSKTALHSQAAASRDRAHPSSPPPAPPGSYTSHLTSPSSLQACREAAGKRAVQIKASNRLLLSVSASSAHPRS